MRRAMLGLQRPASASSLSCPRPSAALHTLCCSYLFLFLDEIGVLPAVVWDHSRHIHGTAVVPDDPCSMKPVHVCQL